MRLHGENPSLIRKLIVSKKQERLATRKSKGD